MMTTFGLTRARELDADLGVRRGDQVDTLELGDELLHERDVRRVVFDVQDRMTDAARARRAATPPGARPACAGAATAGGSWCAGSSIQNSDPSPGMLAKPPAAAHELREPLR